MTHRVHNFSAGPAAMPLPVLEQAQQQLVDFDGSGMSIMEMSHRGKIYDRVHNEAIADLRALLGIGDDYAVLFMQGGARAQFALVPMNLRAKGQVADYLVTGTWSEGAVTEAQRLGETRVAYSSAETGHDRVPEQGAYELSPNAAYVHYTSNNTIFGTQYAHVPDSGGAPLVCDMSSDILSRPVDVSKFGVIYAGAQKNMGPSGVTVAIVRRDLLERSPADLADVFNYGKMAAKNSLLNTPPTFGIYLVGLVAKHLLGLGGLEAVAKTNRSKAERLYAAIDGSGGFYKPHAQLNSRSQMNVTFRLPSEELEARFVEESAKARLVGLKGHRSVGGVRASIYNAVSMESVEALLNFMADFQSRKG